MKDPLTELLKKRVVQEEIDGVVFSLRPMSIKDAIKAGDLKEDRDIAANMALVCEILADCVCDDNGVSLTPSDSPLREHAITTLTRLGANTLAVLFQRVCSISALSEEEADETLGK